MILVMMAIIPHASAPLSRRRGRDQV